MECLEFDLERYNKKKKELGEAPLILKTTKYEKPVHDGTYLLDKDGNRIGTKGDMYTKVLLSDILQRGCIDYNPRPKYEDGEPAHTLSLNHGQTTSGIFTYNIAAGESPFITLRPIAIKGATGEILWIYQDASNDLAKLAEYGVTWWNQWALPDNTIGSVYGKSVFDYDLMRKLLIEMEKNPDGRRNIICL